MLLSMLLTMQRLLVATCLLLLDQLLQLSNEHGARGSGLVRVHHDRWDKASNDTRGWYVLQSSVTRQ
jgi:hypothetical protein